MDEQNRAPAPVDLGEAKAPKEASADDFLCGLTCGIKQDGQMHFQIFGTQPNLISLLGLAQYITGEAEKELARFFSHREMQLQQARMAQQQAQEAQQQQQVQAMSEAPSSGPHLPPRRPRPSMPGLPDHLRERRPRPAPRDVTPQGSGAQGSPLDNPPFEIVPPLSEE